MTNCGIEEEKLQEKNKIEALVTRFCCSGWPSPGWGDAHTGFLNTHTV